jgi:RND family efflux transporter MFP subunit
VDRDAPGVLLGRADVAMLREIADSTAIALSHANRIDAERRASDLGQLLEVAQELSSHLDVQKVTFTLVHRMATVVRYSRASVALLRGTETRLAAVSGQTFIDETQPEMKLLTDTLAWAAGLDAGVYVVQEDDGSIDTERIETAEKFRAFFEKTGSRSFLAVPLSDDEGRIGALALEAATPYAFSGHDLEAATLLAVHATVSIRNALLYEQMPMARVFRPLARTEVGGAPRRSAWASRRVRFGAAALALAAIGLVPAPLRVGGDARVLAETRLPVTAEVAGRVAQVLVREGDRVASGDVVALLDDGDYETGRDDAEARFRIALRERERHVAAGSTAEAEVELARLSGLRAEVGLWSTRVARTRLVSPVDGIVATPRVDERVGESLDRGETLCEIVDDRPRLVEVAIDEADAGLLAADQPVKIKLAAYPTRAFRGQVERVGVAATLLEDEQRVFLVRVRLEDPGAPLSPGMTGQAKVTAGTTPLARVVARRPARWLWGVVWGFLP